MQRFVNMLPLQSESPERGMHILLRFIFLLPFKDLFRFPSLKKIFRKNEKDWSDFEEI